MEDYENKNKTPINTKYKLEKMVVLCLYFHFILLPAISYQVMYRLW